MGFSGRDEVVYGGSCQVTLGGNTDNVWYNYTPEVRQT